MNLFRYSRKYIFTVFLLLCLLPIVGAFITTKIIDTTILDVFINIPQLIFVWILSIVILVILLNAKVIIDDYGITRYTGMRDIGLISINWKEIVKIEYINNKDMVLISDLNRKVIGFKKNLRNYNHLLNTLIKYLEVNCKENVIDKSYKNYISSLVK